MSDEPPFLLRNSVTETPLAPIRPSRQGLWWPIALAVVLASVFRGILLFGTPLIPGTNGAYYLVQARALLTRGALGIPDLPLTFYLQASLAGAVRWISGQSLDACVLFSVKLADSILPALVALPVALLVRRWAKTAGAPGWIAPAAAGVAGLNAPMLGMVGNLEKNSLGILWLCLLLLFIHLWLTRPTLPNAAGVLCFWGFSAVTHIGVFGASVMFGCLAIVIFFARQRVTAWHAVWPLLGAVLAVGAIAAAVVLWKFDPRRIQKLAEALLHPADYLTGGNKGPGGPGFPRPPIVFTLIQAGAFLVFACTSIAALTVCWRRRAALPVADLCVAGACALGVLVLTGPWVQGDKAHRFHLIAIMPAVMAGAFALIYCKRRRLRAGIALVVAACMIGPSFFLLHDGVGPILNEDGLRELRSLAPLIADPDKTLVAARHGMEWWTAWALHTRIAQIPALRIEDWRNFDAVFFLRSKKENHPSPPGGSVLQKALGAAFPPPPGSPPPGVPPPKGTDRLANPMEEPQIPRGAEIVHDGKSFSLFRVAAPPKYVSEQTSMKQ